MVQNILLKMSKFIVSVKQFQERDVLTIVDLDLIGKKIEDEKKQLDLSCRFYQGEEKSDIEVIELLKQVDIINACGKDAITLLKKQGYEFEELLIVSVPHIQIIQTKC